MANQNKMSLTPREQELAALVWGCFEVEPKINMKKFTKAAGFANVRSTAACWGPVKKKLIAQAEACAKDTDDAEGDDDNNGDGSPTAASTASTLKAKAKGPTKKTTGGSTGGKKRKAKTMTPAYANNDEDDVDDDLDTPSKKIKAEDAAVKTEENFIEAQLENEYGNNFDEV